MPVTLLAPLWATNARVQRAAHDNPPMQQHEGDHAAVRLLQEALIRSGFAMPAGVDGDFGLQTAHAVVAAENRFGFTADAGVAGREVLGALDLVLRGWSPPAGAHWGGLLARTIIPIAQRKIRAALSALFDIQTIGFDFVLANGVTMAALKTHFKLAIPGGGFPKLAQEESMTNTTINPLIHNFLGIQLTISNSNMIRHSICSNGLNTAAESPFGGPILFGPPYSDFRFGPIDVTNIDRTGPNSLAAMMMHEATHVIDSLSGDTTTHISEFQVEYETQTAANARHNPSAYATFAAHIDAQADRPRAQRFGLGLGRPF